MARGSALRSALNLSGLLARGAAKLSSMFGRSKKATKADSEPKRDLRPRDGRDNSDNSDTASPEDIIASLKTADARRLEEDAGPLGKAFISAVDAAVHLQSGTIRAYVNWLRRQNPEASPQELQEIMAAHFRKTAATTGAGAGAAAAIPGVGLITGGAAIAGESVLFLDLAAFYTVASAYLRGLDIKDRDRRRTVVLATLTGAQGVAIVDTILGGGKADLPSKHTLARFSGPGLQEANDILSRFAMKSLNKRMRRSWLGKLLPLGIGAFAGRSANRKLADAVLNNVAESLGPAPSQFTEPLPEKGAGDKDEREAEAKLSANPREFAAWIVQLFTSAKRDSNAKRDK